MNRAFDVADLPSRFCFLIFRGGLVFVNEQNLKKESNSKGLFIGSALLGIGCLPIVLFFTVILGILSFVLITDDNDANKNAFGTFCRAEGQVDMDAFSSVLSNAGVFRSMDTTFISIANEFGIDPVLMAAIALHETGYGTSNAVVNKNNPGGLMNPATGSKQLYLFNTLEEGLRAMGKTLHNRIIKDGLNTIEKLGAVYAPIGASNDPNNLNSHWVPNVTKITADLGGLTLNCEAEVEMLGNEAFQIILNEMLKYHGWGYVWGGYTPSTGFDCSGLMQWGYRMAGITLPRTSYEQSKASTPITRSDLQPGDLIFFKTASYAPVTHVGMYVGNGQMFNANDSGVEYSNPFDAYWGSRIVGYGRVGNFSY